MQNNFLSYIHFITFNNYKFVDFVKYIFTLKELIKSTFIIAQWIVLLIM